MTSTAPSPRTHRSTVTGSLPGSGAPSTGPARHRIAIGAPADRLAPLLLDLADTLDEALGAVLDDDGTRARRLLRSGRRRRACLAHATTIAGLGLPSGTSRERRASTDRVLLAADLQRLERVLEQLARTVVGGGAAEVDTGTRTALERLRHCGTQRLRNLALHPCGPTMTRDHHRCGQELLDLLGVLDPPSGLPGGPSSASSGECHALRLTAAALSATLLDASRHAARAALGDRVA